ILCCKTFLSLTQSQDCQQEKRHELDHLKLVTDDPNLFQADEVFGKDSLHQNAVCCVLTCMGNSPAS
ncbi:MAG: hypothetical protein RIC29_14365, partial [Rhodospirillaceae bacterium]